MKFEWSLTGVMSSQISSCEVMSSDCDTMCDVICENKTVL